MNFDSKNGRRRYFLLKPKHQNCLSQQGENVYSAQSWKKKEILCKSMFIPIERQTSILKIVEKQIFLVKPKHQNHLSQWGESDYGA